MNKFEKRSISAYNKKADKYDSTFDGKFTLKFKTTLLDIMDIQTGDTVLDIACGNGRFLNMLSMQHSFYGYGVDISENMIEQAKLLNSGMYFSTASCEQLPYDDHMFDIITVCAAYHHFPNVNGFTKEACRLLKKGGKIYIAEVYLPTLIRAICNPFVPLLKEGDVKFYSPDNIMETLKNAGFKKQEYIKNGHIQIVSGGV